MKKLILSLLIFMFANIAYSQTIIQMQESGGVYKIPCLVNGARMKLVFDTGASNVCLSETMAEYLFENEYISITDVIESGSSTVADGRVVDVVILNLREIEISGLKLKNVRASIVEGQNAPLLLGQSAIQQLGSITIDNDKLIVNNRVRNLDGGQIIDLCIKADKYANDEYYLAAIDCFEQAESAAGGLHAYWLLRLAYCYYQTEQFDKCIEKCNQWLQDDDYYTKSDTNCAMIYDYLADSYYFGGNNYDKAILWSQKLLSIDDDCYSILYCKLRMAWSYEKLKDYYIAIQLYKEIIKEQCEYIDVTIDDVRNNKVKNSDLGCYLYFYSIALYGNDNEKYGDDVMSLAAKCGYNSAIDFCKKHNISYGMSSSLFE